MEFINIFLAQAATTGAAAGPAANPLLQFVPLVFIVIIFYFMLIRPQQKRQKEHQALISAVKVGDRVITSSGIHGLVQSVKDKTVMVKVADNVKIEFDKASIGSVERSSSSEEEVKAS
ncbi:MAG: preprotein translocase subunit YajC [Chthoniobacterales bacterium]